ncbi:hypothetical protein [Pseudomonas sp. PSPC2-3]|uniref:hypothetical protein n=1 Tax=Pseudomonas sp. PSPC2-3 TaxID=2804561 RepID=UPI003CF28AE0
MSSTKQYFVHSHALCESENIGKDTRVWAFAHILPGASLGSECNVCDNVFIENDVIIGDRVTLKCGVQVWDGITIDATSSLVRMQPSRMTCFRAARSTRRPSIAQSSARAPRWAPTARSFRA